MPRPRCLLHDPSGFTILELLIVVIIIALLAVLAVTQFIKSAQNTKADQAINMIQQIAAAQHMYYLDAQTYPTGVIDNNCNDSTYGCGNPSGPQQCQLVRCHFLAKRNWDDFGYSVFVITPATAQTLCGFPVPGGAATPAACAVRKTCPVPSGDCAQTSARDANWGYLIDNVGAVYTINGALAEEGAVPSSPPPH